jgi:uncharacterized coiled-coil protein SlyX
MLQVGPSPDVWLQLLERCAADPACHPTAMRGLAQQLAKQRVLTADHQQSLAWAHHMIGRLIDGSGRHQQHQWMVNCSNQQQVSALQQVVAEQGAYIAGLEGQLQQLREELQELRQQQPH